MKLAHYYKTLGLRRGASLREVKAAYRELVRKCHPDLNPDQAAIDQFIAINNAYTALTAELKRKGQRHQSEPAERSTPTKSTPKSAPKPGERLNLRELKLTLERLGLGNFQNEPDDDDWVEEAAEQVRTTPEPSEPTVNYSTAQSTPARNPGAPAVNAAEQAAEFSTPPISEQEAGLKEEAYSQLKTLLQQQKFPRAIALVEGLAHRIPEDLEINQWQAIVYQRWGRYLIGQGQLHKAHVYLHKALQTDPHNPSLCEEVTLDLGQLDLLVQAASVT